MAENDRQQARLAIELVYAFYVRSCKELRTMEEVKLEQILRLMIFKRIRQGARWNEFPPPLTARQE